MRWFSFLGPDEIVGVMLEEMAPAESVILISTVMVDDGDPISDHPAQTVQRVLRTMWSRALGLNQRAITLTTFDEKGSSTRCGDPVHAA